MTILSDLDSTNFAAFFKERCADHAGFLWPHANNITQPRIHLSLVAIQYLGTSTTAHKNNAKSACTFKQKAHHTTATTGL